MKSAVFHILSLKKASEVPQLDFFCLFMRSPGVRMSANPDFYTLIKTRRRHARLLLFSVFLFIHPDVRISAIQKSDSIISLSFFLTKNASKARQTIVMLIICLFECSS